MVYSGYVFHYHDHTPNKISYTTHSELQFLDQSGGKQGIVEKRYWAHTVITMDILSGYTCFLGRRSMKIFYHVTTLSRFFSANSGESEVASILLYSQISS